MAPLTCCRVQREITITQAMTWMIALAGSVAALFCASMLFLADKEQQAGTFAAGGLALIVWAAFHLTDRQPQHR